MYCGMTFSRPRRPLMLGVTSSFTSPSLCFFFSPYARAQILYETTFIHQYNSAPSFFCFVLFSFLFFSIRLLYFPLLFSFFSPLLFFFSPPLLCSFVSIWPTNAEAPTARAQLLRDAGYVLPTRSLLYLFMSPSLSFS